MANSIITVNSKTDITCLPDLIHCNEHNFTYVVFLPKMSGLSIIMRKQLDKSKLRGIPQNNWVRCFKNTNVLKDKKSWQMFWLDPIFF